MPLLGSKRRRTEPDTKVAQTNKSGETTERKLSVDTLKVDNGPKSAPLRTKASSPQLAARDSAGSVRRPGLNRNFSKSWYGSWSGKASAVAQVAKESISVAGGLTKESSAEDTDKKPNPQVYGSVRRGSKSTPLVGEPTRVNATRMSSESKQSANTVESKDTTAAKVDSPTQTKKSDEVVRPGSALGVSAKDGAAEESANAKSTAPVPGWFGWWSRPDGYAASETEKSKDGDDKDVETVKQPLSEPEVSKDLDEPNGDVTKTIKSKPSFMSERAEKPPEMQTRAWFGLWSASQNHQASSKPPSLAEEPDTKPVNQSSESQPTAGTDSKDSKQPPTLQKLQTDVDTSNKQAGSDGRPKSSGWAFWSRDSSQDLRELGDGTQKHLGEIAVADTPSQSHPEAAQFNQPPERKEKEQSNPKSAPASVDSATKALKAAKEKESKSAAAPDTKANKQIKKTIQTDNAFATSAKSASTTSLPLPKQPKDVPAEGATKEEAALTPATKALKAQQQKPNMIEPQFRKTFPLAYVPSYWEALGYYLGYPFGVAPITSTSAEHVSISPQKPKIKNAIAIGVHGYFPTPLVQKIIGQPTGTSIKFATHAAAAIRAWTQANQPDLPCEIEQVALEGEGFIADRVSTLWKLLLNWLSQLRSADFILVAAHSQGVPVAVMLVAKLIQLGCLNPHAKIGICAMAGVNLGPFADYKSRFFGGSAAELFEFSRPGSRVSREYASSVDIVLRHGVRITYVGSIDDQLVSLESSLFSNLTHPYVQRAVFVDGRLHAPDFITHLVAFALKLRNLGISDHGLIRELSFPLAGSIYGGEGHSRVYDDDAVYALALEFTLETTELDPKTVLRTAGGVTAEGLSHQERRRSIEHRRSQGYIPGTTALANSIRRGSMSASVMPGVAPLIAPYEVPLSGVGANPYFLPWAMRGILEEPAVKSGMQGEVKDLVRLFDEWKPASKPLKDVKFRLEAVKSKL